MFFAMSPILQMMPSMTQKWCPNGLQNQTKKDQKINPKTDALFECILASVFHRFCSVWGPKTGLKINPKSIKNRSWAPMATPRPPKTHQRPSQDPPKTENRPQIDPKSAPNPSNIDKTSTQHRTNIYAEFTCRSLKWIIIDQGCKHTKIQVCKDKAIYEVSDLLVILLLRISERLSTKGPAAWAKP